MLLLLFRAKWYTVSVTEEEVHRGLLYMDNRDQKAFFYRRRITDLEKNYQDKSAGKFIDKRVRDTDSLLNLFPDLTLFGTEFSPSSMWKQRGFTFLFDYDISVRDLLHHALSLQWENRQHPVNLAGIWVIFGNLVQEDRRLFLGWILWFPWLSS